MAFAQPKTTDGLAVAGSPRLAILRPDRDFLDLLGRDLAKERSYSQPCREWPEVKSHLAILVAPADRRGDESGEPQPERIWGLGIVRPARETDRDRKVVVTCTRRLPQLVPAVGLLGVVGERVTGLSWSLPESGPVTVGASSLLAGLLRSCPEVKNAVENLMPWLDETPGWTKRELRWRDERDALLLFAKIAGLASKDFAPVHSWDREKARTSFLSGLTGTPTQQEFGGIRGQAAENFNGVGEIVLRPFVSDRGRQRYDVEVTSIVGGRVAAGEEGFLDAYYYHYESQTLVALRYLRPTSSGLLSLETGHSLAEFLSRVKFRPSSVRRGLGDYGLLNDPLFLRVHEPVPFTSSLHRTSSGAIYPYDQIYEAVSASAVRGLPVPFNDMITRHLVPTDFARLVRDGWLGARDVTFGMVLDWVEATVQTGRVALVFVDFSSRPRGNGSGIETRSQGVA
ncbi:hypothetical protein OG875_22815 [Streptomyces sp. NBC_01498]|uniref:hypothetical protein n=1 Tax=Streptomyces sp. NBC_01498 TaxID=2975870 RepID=UPI002E7B406D|nr:hypothetical protein [Streptomyces sp. NBC_01498]WTL27146.1 hypothetical protein OG875_22815 [Streptomyces sp. NBC_01498]